MALFDFFKANIEPLNEELAVMLDTPKKTLVPSKNTQTEKAYNLLKRAGMHGVSNASFANIGILRYGQVIKNLRDDYGLDIITERKHLPDGRATNTYIYILVSDNGQE